MQVQISWLMDQDLAYLQIVAYKYIFIWSDRVSNQGPLAQSDALPTGLCDPALSSSVLI